MVQQFLLHDVFLNLYLSTPTFLQTVESTAREFSTNDKFSTLTATVVHIFEPSIKLSAKTSFEGDPLSNYLSCRTS